MAQGGFGREGDYQEDGEHNERNKYKKDGQPESYLYWGDGGEWRVARVLHSGAAIRGQANYSMACPEDVTRWKYWDDDDDDDDDEDDDDDDDYDDEDDDVLRM